MENNLLWLLNRVILSPGGKWVPGRLVLLNTIDLKYEGIIVGTKTGI